MLPTLFTTEYTSPCGKLILGECNGLLVLCDWTCNPHLQRNVKAVLSHLATEQERGQEIKHRSPVLQQAVRMLDLYFSGKLQEFKLPVCPIGTPFQQQVWKSLLQIPYGHTASYQDIALKMRKPKGVRAIAQAIGANRLSLFIPCHRIIGSNGTLTGYAGGTDTKKYLLDLERKVENISAQNENR